MTRPHDTVVEDQFGPRADFYVTSAVHAAGEDLDALETTARRLQPRRALDLGAGGGHVAYRLAPHSAEVTAVDLSEGMMAAVAATARERGLANITTRTAPAERLPFDDATFDFLACRFTAHHWRDFGGGLREARRVLAEGATAIFIDAVAPAHSALDSHLQAIELLRDPSHVRDYRIAEWTAALGDAGFAITRLEARRLRMDYGSWVERMRTDAVHRAAIRSLQRQAAREIVDHFEIEADGSFLLDTVQIEMMAA
jgi:SAM-dependent methyltransferase